jgi:hypothetical protein
VPAQSNSYPSIPALSTVSTTASLPQAPAPWPVYTPSNPEPLDPYTVNLAHLELFHNTYSREFLSFEESQPDIIPAELYLKYALTTPYLMYQLLGASALNLSTRTKDSRNPYREYAAGLQNRALSIFKQVNPMMEVTPANCVHMYLFSTSVAVHLLCDTLHYQRDGLEEFINGFTHCLSVCRGILAVVSKCAGFLHESALGPSLERSRAYRRPSDSSGSECDDLQDMVNAAIITPSLRKIYLESIAHLQQVFDAQPVASESGVRLPQVIAWLILMSPEYVEVLRQRQEEALIILARYAVILHRGRNLWLFGDGGRFLIESVCASLGPQLQKWLKIPKAALQEDLKA